MARYNRRDRRGRFSRTGGGGGGSGVRRISVSGSTWNSTKGWSKGPKEKVWGYRNSSGVLTTGFASKRDAEYARKYDAMIRAAARAARR